MASVEQVVCAIAGGSAGAFREQVGRSSSPGSGSRAAFAGGCCAGVPAEDLACLLVDCGLGEPAERGLVLELLDAKARELSAGCVRAWPPGMATGLAFVALLELAPRPGRWTDAERLDRLAGLGLRVSKAAWSQTWAQRYQGVLGEAQRRVGAAVQRIREQAA